MSERLHQIGYILMSAGSDQSTITLNVPDTKLLELHDLAGSKQVFKGKEKKYIWNDTTKEYDLKDVEVETLGVVPEMHVGTKKIMAYTVCVGLARQALKKLLDGQPVEGCRQPDVQAPQPEHEEEMSSV